MGQPLKYNLIANLFGQSWANLVGLLCLPIFGNWLGLEALGVITFYAALYAWLGFLDFGLAATLNRELPQLRSDPSKAPEMANLARSAEMVLCVIFLAVSVALVASSSWIAQHWLTFEELSQAEVSTALAFAGVTIGLRIFETIYRGAFQGLEQQVFFSSYFAVQATLRWPGTLLALLISPTIVTFFIWQLGISIIGLIVLRVVFWRSMRRLAPAGRPRFDGALLRRHRNYSLGMLVTAVSGALVVQGDKMVVGAHLVASDLGIYGLAATLASGLMVLSYPLGTAFYPRVADALTRGDVDAGLSYAQLHAKTSSVIAIAPQLAVVLSAPAVMLAWTGAADVSEVAAPLLVILCAASITNAIVSPFYLLIIGSGRSFFTAAVTMVLCPITLLAAVFAVRQFGMPGVAVVWLGYNLGLLAAYGAITARLFGVRPMASHLWKVSIRPLLALIVMMGPVAVALNVAPLAEASPLLKLAVMAVATTAAMWILGAFVLKLPGLKQLLGKRDLNPASGAR